MDGIDVQLLQMVDGLLFGQRKEFSFVYQTG